MSEASFRLPPMYAGRPLKSIPNWGLPRELLRPPCDVTRLAPLRYKKKPRIAARLFDVRGPFGRLAVGIALSSIVPYELPNRQGVKCNSELFCGSNLRARTAPSWRLAMSNRTEVSTPPVVLQVMLLSGTNSPRPTTTWRHGYLTEGEGSDSSAGRGTHL